LIACHGPFSLPAEIDTLCHMRMYHLLLMHHLVMLDRIHICWIKTVIYLIVGNIPILLLDQLLSVGKVLARHYSHEERCRKTIGTCTTVCKHGLSRHHPTIKQAPKWLSPFRSVRLSFSLHACTNLLLVHASKLPFSMFVQARERIWLYSSRRIYVCKHGICVGKGDLIISSLWVWDEHMDSYDDSVRTTLPPPRKEGLCWTLALAQILYSLVVSMTKMLLF
jgi:hypothetical protein